MKRNEKSKRQAILIMSEIKIDSKHIILATTCIFFGVFYLIKSRKRRFNPAVVVEKVHKSGNPQHTHRCAA